MSETETALLLAFGVDEGEATEQWFSTMGDFAPKRIFGNIWRLFFFCIPYLCVKEVFLAFSGQRLEMLRTILQCRRHPLTTTTNDI